MSGTYNNLEATTLVGGGNKADQSKHLINHQRTKSISQSPSLMMSDYWFLAGLILALFSINIIFSEIVFPHRSHMYTK